MIKKMYKKLRYVTCKAKQLLVHPVEAFVEEAGELVPKRHTVAVIKATLVGDLMNEGSCTFISCCIIVFKHLTAPLKGEGVGAREDDQTEGRLHEHSGRL